jgi:hypothetical protein
MSDSAGFDIRYAAKCFDPEGNLMGLDIRAREWVVIDPAPTLLELAVRAVQYETERQ